MSSRQRKALAALEGSISGRSFRVHPQTQQNMRTVTPSQRTMVNGSTSVSSRSKRSQSQSYNGYARSQQAKKPRQEVQVVNESRRRQKPEPEAESESEEENSDGSSLEQSSSQPSNGRVVNGRRKAPAVTVGLKGKRGLSRGKGQSQVQSQSAKSQKQSKSKYDFIDDEASSEEDSDDDEDEDGDHSKNKSKSNRSKTKSKPKKPKSPFEFAGKGGICLPKETLVQNAVLYLLVKQNKSTAITRAEITRDALNGQRKVFEVVIKKVEKILLKTFLLKLIGVEASKTEGQFDSYILVSRVPRAVLHDPSESTESELEEKVLNFLYLVLTVIFMSGNRLEEARIWELLTEMEFRTDLCPEKENFEKFLRTEYVCKHYLDEVTRYNPTGNRERGVATYEWGVRSLHQFSKMKILQNVAKQLEVPDVTYFAQSYKDARRQIEDFGSLDLISDNTLDDSEDISNVNEFPLLDLSDLQSSMNSVSVETSTGTGTSSSQPLRKWTQEQINNSLVETQPTEEFDSDTE